jgi:hypothetical protein
VAVGTSRHFCGRGSYRPWSLCSGPGAASLRGHRGSDVTGESDSGSMAKIRLLKSVAVRPGQHPAGFWKALQGGRAVESRCNFDYKKDDEYHGCA